jgi:hypothetical protein
MCFSILDHSTWRDVRRCNAMQIICRENSFERVILKANSLEPGGGSIWSAEGNRASKRLTRRTATNNRTTIHALASYPTAPQYVPCGNWIFGHTKTANQAPLMM